MSQWIYAGLVDMGLAAICVETRHMHAALSARINKTDRNDARGIAQMMRVGLFKAVHVKTPASQHRRLLLTSRKLLQRKIYDIENDLRGSLRNFGLKVGVVGAAKFEDRIRELVSRSSRGRCNRWTAAGSARRSAHPVCQTPSHAARSRANRSDLSSL